MDSILFVYFFREIFIKNINFFVKRKTCTQIGELY